MGSFYNVLVDRLPNGQDVVKSRSECSFCHTVLKWYDLFPVFSYLFLKGRCRYCGEKLSPRYLLSELAVGGLFLLEFFVFRQNMDVPQMIAELALWSMLFVVAMMDWKYGIVMDRILVIFTVIGVAALLIGKVRISRILLGAAAGFALYGLVYVLARLFYKREAFGVGDVLLLTAAGAFLGPVHVLIAGFLSFYCCLLFLIVPLIKKKGALRGQEFPFAPPVCLAVLIMSLFGDRITGFLGRLLGF